MTPTMNKIPIKTIQVVTILLQGRTEVMGFDKHITPSCITVLSRELETALGAQGGSRYQYLSHEPVEVTQEYLSKKLSLRLTSVFACLDTDSESV